MCNYIGWFDRPCIRRRCLSFLLILISAAVCFLAPAAHSYENNLKVLRIEDSLGLIKNVSLMIEDEISGQCWTNSDKIRQQSKLILEQSELKVYEEPLFIISPFSVNLVISALGERSGEGRCFGSFRIESFRQTLTHYNGVKIQYRAANFTQNMVASGSGRGNLNDHFLEAADNFVSMFSSQVTAARKLPLVSDVIEQDKTTYNDANVITMREFVELISRTGDGTAVD